MCGGTGLPAFSKRSPNGLSPRVRGNLVHPFRLPSAAGSIPACAGEPPTRPGAVTRLGVYPRVCGGTGFINLHAITHQGLSPRVRGNRHRRILAGGEGGSIPACAGEPGNARAGRSPAGVYPRVCGGTADTGVGRLQRHGLSPRVRGNLYRLLPGADGVRSIPACAGEPDEIAVV